MIDVTGLEIRERYRGLQEQKKNDVFLGKGIRLPVYPSVLSSERMN